MSKLIFFLLTFIFFSVDNKIKAQHNSFKKIEYASFDINSPRTKEKDSANIDLYSIIDANGFVTILNDDNYHNTLTFYTYKLSISQLKRINSIFNNKKNLKDYIVKKKLNDSVLFAGSYNFF